MKLRFKVNCRIRLMHAMAASVVFCGAFGFPGTPQAETRAPIADSVVAHLEWARTYDGGNDYLFAGDYARHLTADNTGRVYVTGYVEAPLSPEGFRQYQVATLCYNSDSTLRWDRKRTPAGGTGPDPGHANLGPQFGIGLQPGGNVVVTGWDYSNISTDYLTIWYNGFGTKLGEATYNSGTDPRFSKDNCRDIFVSNSGTVYVTGTSSNGVDFRQDITTIKYSPGGVELWTARYPCPVAFKSNHGHVVKVDTAGGVFVGGISQEASASNIGTLIKYSPFGTQLWVEKWNGEGFQDMTLDKAGNVYLLTSAKTLIKYNTDGVLQWAVIAPGVPVSSPHRVRVDDQGNVVYATTNWVDPGNTSLGTMYRVVRYDVGGNLLWDEGFHEPISNNMVDMELDPSGNIYITGSLIAPSSGKSQVSVIAVSPAGSLLWKTAYAGTNQRSAYPHDLFVDDSADVYVCGYVENRLSTHGNMHSDMLTLKYTQLGPKTFYLIDAMLDSIPNVEFTVATVEYQLATRTFTESEIGSYTTDSLGMLNLTGLVNTGDQIRIWRKLHSEPAVRHDSILGTMYTVYLDNGEFDSLGALSYHEVGAAPGQVVLMDHTTIAFNLVVSIEWDARLDYHQETILGSRHMTNYFYDVSDGQMVFDTIMIFDDGLHWDDADLRVYASNMIWPHVDGGIPPMRDTDGYIHQPRKWFGGSDVTRNLSYAEDPLLMSHRGDYGTRLHEFGHYGLSFYDEYKFFPPWGDRCADRPKVSKPYGYMDVHYLTGEPYASEMSSAAAYSNPACQNTIQWFLNSQSCWDQTESLFERRYDSVLSPINKPEERFLPGSLDYFPGPNSNLVTTDLNVGRAVVFPVAHTEPTSKKYEVLLTSFLTGDSLPDASVRLLKTADAKVVDQGNTDDLGRIRVLDVDIDDIIIAAGKVDVTGVSRGAGMDEVWMFGEATVGGSGVSRFGNRFSSSVAADSLELSLQQVEGDYPLLPRVVPSALGGTFELTTLNSFSSNPTLDHSPEGGSQSSYSFAPASPGYTATFADSLGQSGSFTIWAVDDSGSTFFFSTDYTKTEIVSAASYRHGGPGGSSEFDIDPANGLIERAVILTSPYPVIRTGLDSLARQGGDAHALAVFPGDTLSGTNSVMIRYADTDLSGGNATFGDELSLRVFHWNIATQQWDLVGGTVDTSFNEVTAAITATGVYAAFTTASVGTCDCPKQGDLAPGQGDNLVDLLDIVTAIDYVFRSGALPPTDEPVCPRARADVAPAAGCGDGGIDLLDIVYLIDFVFRSGPPPCDPCSAP